MNNLGDLLGTWYTRTREAKALEEAVDTSRQAVQLILLDHPSRATCLHTLGKILWTLWIHAGETKDLEEAIDITRQALQMTPLDHVNWTSGLTMLGVLLGSQYELTGEESDLEEAIMITRQATQSISLDHPNRAGILNNLGSYFERRYKRTGETDDVAKATECFLEAFGCLTTFPLERVKAVAEYFTLPVRLRKTAEGIKLGKGAIALLPLVHTRNLDRDDQEFVVSGFADIASNLCALLLSESRLHEAVECLESGRAVIISRLLDDRSDTSGLSPQYPEIAQRYQSLIAKFNTSLRTAEDDCITTAEVTKRREALADLEACLQEIRAIPGYDRFLLGQTVAQMQEEIHEGYIVIVNVSTSRSDAIVMTSDSLQTIPLSNMTLGDVERWLSADWSIRKNRRREHKTKNNEFLEYLAWLWRVCVEDILDHIAPPNKRTHYPLPRVWWIGCGLASSMPLHAAGLHTGDSEENALSRVVSSYTPSVKTLAYARRQIKHTQSNESTRDQMLIALMPTTPRGANDTKTFDNLGGVAKEKEMLFAIVSNHMDAKVLTAPSADDVADELAICSIAHFACHGESNPHDPSSSALVLQRTASDGTHEQDRLSINRISQLQLRQAQIAYLSACSTADNKKVRLRDEVIHIVSGFQVAGFPHVIGSLWPVGDKECTDVASGFYSKLFENGSVSDFGGRQVACALQEAMMAVRAQDMDMPLNWAQFVHFGA